MTRNLYFENYINNLQIEIFSLAFNNFIEMKSFISFYMKSDIRAELDKDYSFYQTQPAIRIYEDVVSSFKNIKYEKEHTYSFESVEFLAYFYSKWHFLTNESSKSIVRFLHPERGLKEYTLLHQLDEMDAIEKCKREYNLLRNNHRKNEIKSKPINLKSYKNLDFLPFLATKLIYKLNKDNYFNKFEYTKDINGYDFTINESLIALNVTVVDKISDLLTEFTNSEIELQNNPNHVGVAFYFCFLLSKYDIDSLLSEIKIFKNNFPSSKRKYGSCYFYNEGTLIEVSMVDEVFVYNLPVSSRDVKGAINRLLSIKSK